jgi:toxin secretion/phage lysis holin
MADKVYAWARGIASVLAGIGSYIYGRLDGLLIALFVVIVIDYITGLIKGGITKTLSSEIGFKGILKKMLILIVVALAHLIDTCVGSDETWRNIAIVFYISNEGLSILENCVVCGLPVPEKFKEILLNMDHTTDEKGVVIDGDTE